MADGNQVVGDIEAGGIALVQNVALMIELVESGLRREAHLPGIVGFVGYSGLGKTFATTHAACHYRAYHVEVGSTFTRGDLLKAILEEMGIKPKGTITDMMKLAAEQLARSRRPLMLDEFDHVARSESFLNCVRDLHDKSGGGTIVIVGEENLEKTLRQHERFHNRILRWQLAQFSNLADARTLAKLYAPGVTIADDLLEMVLRTSRNVARRLCVNISAIAGYAASEGLSEVDLATWGKRPLDSGDAPKRAA